MQNLISALFILVVAATTVMAGTRTAHPGEEARAIGLWNKHCANGGEGGREGSVYIHCKHPRQPETYSLQATVNANPDHVAPREQYIFVQPPSLHFTHALDVGGGEQFEPKTIVYVQPAKTSHRYTANISTKDAPHSKPELVFLSNSGDQVLPSTGPRPIPVRSRTIASSSSRARGDDEQSEFSES